MKVRLPSDLNPEERGEKARCLFLKGYNCCQSVLLAFADILQTNGLTTSETLAVIGSGFGGGMGRIREVCGSFSASVMMAGFICPADSTDKSRRAANYSLVQDFAARFKDCNGGSVVCAELLGLRERRAESPVPSDRTNEYYSRRPCPQIIANTATIIARKLLEIASDPIDSEGTASEGTFFDDTAPQGGQD